MTAQLVGINHVALEVGDLEQALAFYGQIFDLELRGRVPGMAFVDWVKAPGVLRGMGLEALEKRPEALAELREKGLTD